MMPLHAHCGAYDSTNTITRKVLCKRMKPYGFPRHFKNTDDSCLELVASAKLFYHVSKYVILFSQWFHSDFQVQQTTYLVKPHTWTEMGKYARFSELSNTFTLSFGGF